MACQRQVHGGGQLRAEAILLKDGGGRFHACDRAGVSRFQPQQNAQQRRFTTTGPPHQHHRAVDRPAEILQNRRGAKLLAEIFYHNAHVRTSPQRRAFTVRRLQAATADSTADSSTITSVQANTSGVDSVILAR